MEELTYHVPVLLNESIEGMNLQPEGIYVDVTFGGGGHSKEILRQGDSSIRLFSFDQDEDAEQNIVNDNRFTFVRSNFRYLYNFLRYHGVEKVDAILADLGVSSHHFDDSERGFSFRFDGKLDMRMIGRHLLSLWRIKEQSKVGLSHCQGTKYQTDCHYRRFLGYRKADVRSRTREERTGQSISGTSHRSEPRNGSAERNALCRNRSLETGRKAGGYHLSFVGRPHGKEHHEDRKHRGQVGTRLLR